MRVCPRCKKEKKEEEFAKANRGGKTQHQTYCKQCQTEYQREYRKTHKQKYMYNKYDGSEDLWK